MTLNGQTLVTWTQSSVSTPTVYPIFILVVFLSWAWYEFVFLKKKLGDKGEGASAATVKPLITHTCWETC